MTATLPIAKPVGVRAAASRDIELIARIVAGERELFHELVRPSAKVVYYTILAVLRNKEEAEDAAQETLVKALQGLHTFRAESKFSTWLVAIALNEARARFRHNRLLRFESVESPSGTGERVFKTVVMADQCQIPLEMLERMELHKTLHLAIRRLPKTYREVLLLRKVEELSVAKTTGVLGISPGLVKTRLLRARLMMRKILARQLRIPPYASFKTKDSMTVGFRFSANREYGRRLEAQEYGRAGAD
jgi:RNA polymerase sigma-70 factor, ECF subfamily